MTLCNKLIFKNWGSLLHASPQAGALSTITNFAWTWPSPPSVNFEFLMCSDDCVSVT
jgi:hypothetical protein